MYILDVYTDIYIYITYIYIYVSLQKDSFGWFTPGILGFSSPCGSAKPAKLRICGDTVGHEGGLIDLSTRRNSVISCLINPINVGKTMPLIVTNSDHNSDS